MRQFQIGLEIIPKCDCLFGWGWDVFFKGGMSCDALSREQMEFSLVCFFVPAVSAVIAVRWIVRAFWISSSMFTSTHKFWNSEVFIQVPHPFASALFAVWNSKITYLLPSSHLAWKLMVCGKFKLWLRVWRSSLIFFKYRHCLTFRKPLTLACLPFFLD